MADTGSTSARTRAAKHSEISFAQERLWIIDKLVEDKALYNTSVRFRLAGPLDVLVLQRALSEIVRRHVVLRTGFDDQDGHPSVVDNVSIDLPVEDLRSDADPRRSAREHQQSIAAQPFVLTHPPLLRVQLYLLGDQHHELLLTVHHIVFDGASVDVLMHELEQIYPALLGGTSSPLAELTVQSADMAARERSSLTGKRRTRSLDYWKTQFGDDLPVLTLPTDRPRPAIQTYRGANVQQSIDAELVSAIEKFCRSERVTPFMLMLTAVSIWLCRYANQQDVAIGSPFALRSDADSQGLIGFFVNTVALRLKCEGEVTFRQMLHQARRVCLDAYDHADLPFGEVVAALGADRELSHSPVFQAMLVVQNRRRAAMLSAQLEMSYLGELPMKRARFDLAMVLDLVPDGTNLTLEYNTDLFNPDSAERMLEHFMRLLGAALAAPDTAAVRLPLISDADRERLLRWSSLSSGQIADCAINALFEQMAANQPNAIALVHGNLCLSYRELDERAERLADFLHANQVEKGNRVGLCLRRTPEFIIAVLAVWKIGAAYVPLDPDLPESRHRYIVGDAGIRQVLTESALHGHYEGLQVFCVDDPAWQQQVATSRSRPAMATPADAIAYAIYTSGSTGEPKGVLIEHRAVSRLLGEAEPLGYGADTIMLQSVNAAFDASVLETWAPLCCGGQLVLYPGQGLDVSRLQNLIAEYRINTITLPASLLDLWVEQLHEATGLSRIVVGGEALSATTISRLYELDRQVTVINHYGPTENGILTSYYPVPRDFSAPVPIGWAVPGTQLLVLNEAGQLQPPGVIGELHVVGQGLARGYLDRPQLTAEKFISIDVGGIATRAYRSGDLVRWQIPASAQDAVLGFVGRSDQQVKIRGFRIELGEIEAKLRACPGVQDAKAIVYRTASGDKQIVAYVIGIEADTPWRTHLQQTLPGYMVPAAFVRVAAWPLTANGKVDWKALPAPDRADYTQQIIVAPSSDLQAQLLVIWQDLLQLDRISIDDNFFEIGGNSLLATRLHNRIRTQFDVDMPLREVFESATIRKLALRVEAFHVADPSLRVVSRVGGNRPPMTPAAQRDHAPLSYSQQRLWFIHQFESDSAQYHIPLRLRLQGKLDIEALRRSLCDLVERHVALSTTFASVDNEPIQQLKRPNTFALRTTDLHEIDPRQRTQAAERHLRDEALRPFDLGDDTALRACLLSLTDSEHWLALTLHHIAADGWSIGILLRELSILYAAHHSGATPLLPALPLQYIDYAHWQRQWLGEAALEPQFAYWEKCLADAPQLHNLPLDRPRAAVQSFRGALHAHTLPADLIKGLGELAGRHEATLFMLLHAAFAVLLSRYSGETDIVVGTPVANRRDEALTPMVGLFVNTLALRSDLSADPSFVELLAQSRAAALDAYEHQDLPLELLVERLNPARSSAYTPLFQILFALQNNEAQTLALPGIDVTSIPFAERYAKFDLALNLQPDGAGMRVEWEYSTDLFDAATIEQMAASYECILAAVLANPQQRSARLPLMDDARRCAALALGNDTDRAYPAQRCVHELIEEQTAGHPHAPAVIHEGKALSYDELNRNANQLARHLRKLGVGPDIPVAMSMQRGPALVTGLLAILKAGGAFLALDSDYPEARLTSMLADSRPPVVLSDSSSIETMRALLRNTPGCAHTKVIDARAATAAWANESDGNLDGAASVEASHLAYVIYTSGSTGRPNGVMNEHRGIVNRLLWMQEAYPLSADDRFLQTAPIAFGASVVEIFWPLIAGAGLVLTDADGHKDPAYLVALIQREAIDILHFVPSMLQAFLDHPDAGHCRSLKHILCGGEVLPGALVRRCHERLAQTEVHHLYGSSETAVLTTAWDCPRDRPVPDNVPIGRPGANTRLYILDTQGQPVPRGVRGEIHIAGRQVARGYLNQPELDAGRFLADPFADAADARMCRSGDLGRQLADGSIEHLGRNDFQIKIRGQRVELGEIESNLLSQPRVRQAIVIAQDYGNGDIRLVAYVIPDEPTNIDQSTFVEALRRHLQVQLPAHMQPAALVVMSRFPLNANGKLDRKALPVPGEQASAVELHAPESELQREILAIWQELLKQSKIGIDCDFFSVGGHSLMALRVVNRIREAFDYELELKAFFSAPTIRALAEAIQRHRQALLASQRFDACEANEIIEF
ncbi:MAG: amino acid adenylation domain-containing protein [Dokdonella sp.]